MNAETRPRRRATVPAAPHNLEESGLAFDTLLQMSPRSCTWRASRAVLISLPGSA
jgi:hypothetical protein